MVYWILDDAEYLRTLHKGSKERKRMRRLITIFAIGIFLFALMMVIDINHATSWLTGALVCLIIMTYEGLEEINDVRRINDSK